MRTRSCWWLSRVENHNVGIANSWGTFSRSCPQKTTKPTSSPPTSPPLTTTTTTTTAAATTRPNTETGDQPNKGEEGWTHVTRNRKKKKEIPFKSADKWNYNCDTWKITHPASHKKIVCDIRTEKLCPYVPVSLRKDIFDAVHGLSQPGANASICLMIDW